MIIESSPTNLDPRVGTDAQSERIDELIFDPLVHRDEHFNMQPWVAEKWEIPDPRTYIFHLRKGIHFHDGRPLTSRDVKWTLDSIRDGSLTTLKTTTYKLVERVDAPDDATVIITFPSLTVRCFTTSLMALLALCLTAAASRSTAIPLALGHSLLSRRTLIPKWFCSAMIITGASVLRWSAVRLTIVPDATTRALELRKGSVDISPGGSLSADMIGTLRRYRSLEIEQQPGTVLAYLAFNLRDPILKDIRVRQALAYAIDRAAMLHYFFGDQGRLADKRPSTAALGL